jgi:TPR repeat protein
MYAIGPALYPGIWRSLSAAQNWFDKAARAGRPAAQYMHMAFMRHGMLAVRGDIMTSFDPLPAGSPDALAPASDSGRRESAPSGEE